MRESRKMDFRMKVMRKMESRMKDSGRSNLAVRKNSLVFRMTHLVIRMSSQAFKMTHQVI